MPLNSQSIDFQKAEAELVPLRDFIDFVNAQVGVYMDCLSSFRGNTVRIERQVARVNRPRPGMKNGQPVMILESFEDPSLPDSIHHRIIASSDFLTANRDGGFSHRQTCWSIIVFMFAYWDEEIRPQIARIREIEPNELKVDALGDLRIVRNAIVHNKGHLPQADFVKLKVLGDLVQPDERIALSHDEMQQVFARVKQAIAVLLLDKTKHLPGAPDPSEIVSVAIQNAGPRISWPYDD
ncbi:MAG TPA: hypothetical protein VGC14_17890 [Rhizobium sp.]